MLSTYSANLNIIVISESNISSAGSMITSAVWIGDYGDSKAKTDSF